MQGLIDLAVQTLEKHNSSHSGKKAARIKEIRCSYGLLACFEPQTLQACFEIFSDDTPCEGAALILEQEPLQCRCDSCGREFSLTSRKFECPYCSGSGVSFTGGNGLVLQAIEAEEESG